MKIFWSSCTSNTYAIFWGLLDFNSNMSYKRRISLPFRNCQPDEKLVTCFLYWHKDNVCWTQAARQHCSPRYRQPTVNGRDSRDFIPLGLGVRSQVRNNWSYLFRSNIRTSRTQPLRWSTNLTPRILIRKFCHSDVYPPRMGQLDTTFPSKTAID